MTAIHSRLTMEKETPSLPPANIVPVKKEAEQHHGDGKYAFASGGGRFDEGKIIAVLTSWNLWLVDGR